MHRSTGSRGCWASCWRCLAPVGHRGSTEQSPESSRTARAAVVPDVALTLRNEKTDQTVATTVSGPEGEFAFRNLNPAMYTVEALKDGFQTVTHPEIEVTLSSTSAWRSCCRSRGPRRKSK